jgi:hypothetical protein
MNEIRNIRWRLVETPKVHDVYDFEYDGVTCTIAAPLDVMLSDNEASRRWIAKHSGFLLAHLPSGKEVTLTLPGDKG